MRPSSLIFSVVLRILKVHFPRWFDKSFTLVCTGNGIAGLNFEHSWGDGVAVLRYFQDIHKDTHRNPRVNGLTHTVSLSSNDTPKKLSKNYRILGHINGLVSYEPRVMFRFRSR